ncbi:beta strand repeat-containing protein, partial [Aquirufa ecclesiirivi]
MKVTRTTYFKDLKLFPTFLSFLIGLTMLLAFTTEVNGHGMAGSNTFSSLAFNKTSSSHSVGKSPSFSRDELLFFNREAGKDLNFTEKRVVQAHKSVNQLLTKFFQKSNYRDLLFSYFPGKRKSIDSDFDSKVQSLRNAVLNKGFQVPVQIISWAELNSAMAAFASRGPAGSPIIYINKEYLEGKASFIYPKAHDNQIVGLLLQEYGHAIDFYLNGDQDTPGDEGALFVVKEMNVEVEPIELAAMQNREDYNKITIQGKTFKVEEAAVTIAEAWLSTISAQGKPTTGASALVATSMRFQTNPPSATFTTTSGGGNSKVVGSFSFYQGAVQTVIPGFIDTSAGNGASGIIVLFVTDANNLSGYLMRIYGTPVITASTQYNMNNSPVGTDLNSYQSSTGPSASTSTLLPASTTGILADGATTATLTVTARNGASTALVGATVVLEQFSDALLTIPTTKSTISPSSATTNASGVATFTVSSKVAPQTIYYRATVTSSGFEVIVTAYASVSYVVGAVTKLQVLMPGETADPGSVTGKTGTPTNQVAGSNTTVTVNAVDANWNVVSSSTPTVAITTSDANDTHPSNAALTAGTGTFIVSFRTAGNQTVTATDQAATLTANTGATTLVTAGAVNKLQVLMPGETAAPGTTTGKTGSPTAQTAGTSLNFTVNAVDAYWNLVSSATPTAVITSSDAQATLPSSAALVGGTKQFAITLKTAGNQTVTATDQAATLTANTGASTVVNADVASKLTVNQQPSNVIANANSRAKFQISDAYGNIISSSTAGVTVVLHQNGVLKTSGFTGTKSKNAVAGIADFADLKISDASNDYTYVASSPGLTGVTTNVFEILIGPPSKLSIRTNPPASVTAGSSISPSITVSIDDALLNTITTATNSVTLSIGSNPGSGVLSGTATVNAVNGIATFSNLSINKIGNGYTLSAASTGLTGINTNSFNVVAGPASKYLVTSSSSSPEAGGTVTFTAQLADANDNPVTTSGQTVTWTKSDANGSFASATSTTNASGVATIVFTTHTVSGTATTVTATTSAISGTSGTITTVAGTATKYLVTSSSSSPVAGATVTITAQLADANNNAVATSGQTVTWTKSDANGSFASATSTTNGSGVATIVFTTHTVSSTATTVTATTSAISGTSGTITTVAGTATKYLVTSSSSSPVAGATVTITAQLADANNNAVATSGQTVTWTKSDANGSFASATSTTNGSGMATIVLTTHTVSGTATTVTATTSAISGTSGTITTVAGTATKYLVTSSSSSPVAGAIVTITAQLADANNNAVATSGQTVTWTKSDANGSF